MPSSRRAVTRGKTPIFRGSGALAGTPGQARAGHGARPQTALAPTAPHAYRLPVSRDSTVDADEAGASRDAAARAVPGVLVIFEAGLAAAQPIAIPPQGVTFGRGVPDG